MLYKQINLTEVASILVPCFKWC